MKISDNIINGNGTIICYGYNPVTSLKFNFISRSESFEVIVNLEKFEFD